ncbi:uracil-DNA glycosylase family protein [Sphingomonas aerolata]
MQREVEDRLAEIAKHHIELVAPKRLLLLGNAASRAILGMELQAARGRLHGISHKVGEAGVVASFHPRFLIEKPAAKAEAWKDLQMLMGARCLRRRGHDPHARNPARLCRIAAARSGGTDRRQRYGRCPTRHRCTDRRTDSRSARSGAA